MAELRTDLKARGLSYQGLKAVLVKRLQEALDADAVAEDEDEDEDENDDDDGDEVFSESDDLEMDDAECDGDTDYEGYECDDTTCACNATQSTRDTRRAGILMWLAADYKFLLVVLGFKGATSKHPCIYCTADLAEPREWRRPRELNERKATDPPDAELGQHCTNLFPFIPRERCRIDVLHMLLRCMDRFINYAALVYLRCWAPLLSKDEDKLKALNAGLGKAFAKSAGQGSVTFAEKSGSTNTWKLTRVNGNGYKKILENFKFADNLPADKESQETAVRHQDTWDTFNDIYTHVNTTEPWGYLELRDTIRMWFSRCVSKYFKDDNGKDKVKLPKNKPLFLASYLLTPYFHCLLSHVPQMVKHKEIYSFTGQNFEKGNHVHQRIHAAASNHIDDNRAVMEQNLRSLMNKVGTEATRLASTPCDHPACSKSYKTQGAWVNHKLNEHGESDELAATFAFKRAHANVSGARPSAVAVTDDAFTRDVNNAYNALLAEGRLVEKKRNEKLNRGATRKRRREIDKEVLAFEQARADPDTES